MPPYYSQGANGEAYYSLSSNMGGMYHLVTRQSALTSVFAQAPTDIALYALYGCKYPRMFFPLSFAERVNPDSL